MSKGIEAQTGPFMHAADAKATKSFGDRSFTVLIAGAYNAGIIGSEYNGIAILDEDTKAVVLDRHMQTSSGYNGPTKAQRDEMARIMDMDWKAFTSFVSSCPRYRGGMPDIDAKAPDQSLAFNNRVESREIFPASAKSDECPYPTPLSDRRDIIKSILGREMHRVDGPYSKVALAWNIKVGGFDTSGHHEGIEVDPAFDQRWEDHAGSDEYLFVNCCESALRSFLEGEYTLWDSDKPVDAKLLTTGRQGGWLVLSEFGGYDITFDSVNDLEECLVEMDDADLVTLYKLVSHLDVDLSRERRFAEMAYQYASERQRMEEEWAQESAPAA